jgi:hypothetical protein
VGYVVKPNERTCMLCLYLRPELAQRLWYAARSQRFSKAQDYLRAMVLTNYGLRTQVPRVRLAGNAPMPAPDKHGWIRVRAAFTFEEMQALKAKSATRMGVASPAEMVIGMLRRKLPELPQ